MYMAQWEYLHIALLPEQVESALYQYGLDGWELASLIVTRYERDLGSLFVEAQDAKKFTAILKRTKGNTIPADVSSTLPS